MNRLVFTVELAAATAATIYILVGMVQVPDHPALTADQIAAVALLPFAAFMVLLALYVAVRLGGPRVLRRWRQWRSARRSVRHRARRRALLMRRHRRPLRHRAAARIGGVR